MAPPRASTNWQVYEVKRSELQQVLKTFKQQRRHVAVIFAAPRGRGRFAIVVSKGNRWHQLISKEDFDASLSTGGQ